jgi:exopolysaccharide biosynthesis protein
MTNGKHFKLLFFLVLFLFSHSDASEHLTEKKPLTDVEKIANIEWKVKEICEGIRLKTTMLNLFDSPQAIFMVEIDTAEANVNYHIGMQEMLATTSSQANHQNAIVAINGSYFNMQKGYSRHFIKINNSILAYTEENEFNTRATGVFEVTNNSIDIGIWDKDKEFHEAVKADYAMASGPLIIDDGNNMNILNSAFVLNRHPRSFAAFAKGCFLLVAIDGRSPGRADGMSLMEVRIFARELGCTDAINLDGGGSTTLYVKGEKGNGVVNVPSDGSERPVKSIIYVTMSEIMQ